jgi:hypothetical protein
MRWPGELLEVVFELGACNYWHVGCAAHEVREVAEGTGELARVHHELGHSFALGNVSRNLSDSVVYAFDVELGVARSVWLVRRG